MSAEGSEIIKVDVGTKVKIELDSKEGMEMLELIIVPDEQADFRLGFLGIGTPLAQAIMGHQAGDKISYYQGDVDTVFILAVVFTDNEPPADLAARREERLRLAVEQAQRTDAMIFASSFSGKWGDYDPQGIEHWDPAELSRSKISNNLQDENDSGAE